ncbi:MAG: hypothetical protein ACK5B9_07015 [Flavobacteriia bacterium]|jgi:hypothetical protein
MKINFKQHFILAVGSSLTLGLAPFSEPHIWGKIRWVRGGAKGMKGIDWFDLFLHGTPWLYLIIITLLFIISKIKSK